MIYTRSIIDTYHGDTIDIPLLANNGVVAMMMKATQGISYVDPTYAQRRLDAQLYGLLTGSYHFATADDPKKQVEHWLQTAQFFGNKESFEFDWEDNGNNSMSYTQACTFVQEFFNRMGFYPLIYGSNFLREKIPATGDSILFKCPLSLASYTMTANLPRGWDHYTLWQYTGDNANSHISPHWFPGASNPLDVYQFDNTVAELKNQWPFSN
jgi:lysozyme